MNDQAANALLKILEEPPRRAMLDASRPCSGEARFDHPFALPGAAPAAFERGLVCRCARGAAAASFDGGPRATRCTVWWFDSARRCGLSARRIEARGGSREADRAGGGAGFCRDPRTRRARGEVRSRNGNVWRLSDADAGGRILARAREGAPHLDRWVELCNRIRASSSARPRCISSRARRLSRPRVRSPRAALPCKSISFRCSSTAIAISTSRNLRPSCPTWSRARRRLASACASRSARVSRASPRSPRWPHAFPTSIARSASIRMRPKRSRSTMLCRCWLWRETRRSSA